MMDFDEEKLMVLLRSFSLEFHFYNYDPIHCLINETNMNESVRKQILNRIVLTI